MRKNDVSEDSPIGFHESWSINICEIANRRTKARGNEWRETFHCRHITDRHPIIFWRILSRFQRTQHSRLQDTKIDIGANAHKGCNIIERHIAKNGRDVERKFRIVNPIAKL